MTTLLGAVAAATAGVARFYELGQVPPSPEYPYGVYSAVFGGGLAYTLDSKAGMRAGVVTVQTFGKTTASATAHLDDVYAALLDVVLVVDGWELTPLRAALDQPAVTRDPNDQGVIGVTAPLTFTATKETG